MRDPAIRRRAARKTRRRTPRRDAGVTFAENDRDVSTFAEASPSAAAAPPAPVPPARGEAASAAGPSASTRGSSARTARRWLRRWRPRPCACRWAARPPRRNSATPRPGARRRVPRGGLCRRPRLGLRGALLRAGERRARDSPRRRRAVDARRRGPGLARPDAPSDARGPAGNPRRRRPRARRVARLRGVGRAPARGLARGGGRRRRRGRAPGRGLGVRSDLGDVLPKRRGSLRARSFARGDVPGEEAAAWLERRHPRRGRVPRRGEPASIGLNGSGLGRARPARRSARRRGRGGGRYLLRRHAPRPGRRGGSDGAEAFAGVPSASAMAADLLRAAGASSGSGSRSGLAADATVRSLQTAFRAVVAERAAEAEGNAKVSSALAGDARFRVLPDGRLVATYRDASDPSKEKSDVVADLPPSTLPLILRVVAADARTSASARANLAPAAMAVASPRVFWAVVRYGGVGAPGGGGFAGAGAAGARRGGLGRARAPNARETRAVQRVRQPLVPSSTSR